MLFNRSTIFLEFWTQIGLILANVFIHAFGKEVLLKDVCLLHTKDYAVDNFSFFFPSL